MILGVDTGGTFTDFVLLTQGPESTRLRTHKVLSTPQAPERAILQGISEMGLEDLVQQGDLLIVHGSTVATNAALEGKGVRTALVTNHGFADLLSIGRQTRPNLYALHTPPAAEPVPPQLCLETGGRLDAEGQTLEDLEEGELEQLVRDLNALKVEAVAINLLFSFLDERHERCLADYLHEHLENTPFISRSSQVLPEYREYERGVATWLNASLGPLVQSYLLRLEAKTQPSPVAVMQSSGGTVSARQAADKAVNLLLSGPAGGLAAAHSLGQILEETRLITFDMGGTSTDVALLDGAIKLSSEGRIGPYPVAVPMVDMHTIGAGGGSIAYVDAGGLLQVGPRSAGAVPGPACYGKGGLEPTVTDANLVLGRLPATATMAGGLALDLDGARQAMQDLAARLSLSAEDAAAGIIRLVNEHMARALRVISVQRGHDPQDFRLCCFGGAGGLHICQLAEALEMRRAIVPMNAGVLSAMGMILAPVERQLSRTHRTLLAEADEQQIRALICQLQDSGLAEMQAEGLRPEQISNTISVDLRYRGQATTLNVAWHGAASAEQTFHQLHEARYGHALPQPVELVNIRLALQAPRSAQGLQPISRREPCPPQASTRLHGLPEPVPLYSWPELGRGQQIAGPALIADSTSTTFIEPFWTAAVDDYGNLFLNRA